MYVLCKKEQQIYVYSFWTIGLNTSSIYLRIKLPILIIADIYCTLYPGHCSRHFLDELIKTLSVTCNIGATVYLFYSHTKV